jgi:hypothetical protein
MSPAAIPATSGRLRGPIRNPSGGEIPGSDAVTSELNYT